VGNGQVALLRVRYPLQRVVFPSPHPPRSDGGKLDPHVATTAGPAVGRSAMLGLSTQSELAVQVDRAGLTGER